jgi:ribonucrease Y
VQGLEWAVLALVAGIAAGAGVGVMIYRNNMQSRLRQAEAEARLQLEAARSKQEERLQRKEENLDRKLEGLERRERQIQSRERQVEQLAQEAEQIRVQQRVELERVSALTQDDARTIILQRVEQETREESARRIREIEKQVREEADKTARKIVSLAIQRCASDYVAEVTVSTVALPSEELKGRIIGREGRNIRAFEQYTGVDIIVDDTPEAVTLSCHDPVRREVARLSLIKLLKDGRIHPTRIEEVVNKTQQEVDQIMREEGERVAYEANVQGLHPDLIKLLGRLKYRTSYGQNVLQHSLECALLAAHMAAELGANINVAKTAALLHDIGKAVDHEVQAVDAISGGRPGARRETLDLYIKRLEALETVATSFNGVQRAFAVQAGREVRVLVQPDQIDDLASIHLARDVAKKIEESLQYPGQIKVTVIRETRSVDYAR